MTTATGLTCVDYLSPKFNVHTFQDSLNNRSIYSEYTFPDISTLLNDHKQSVTRSGGDIGKTLNYNSCVHELRCNLSKLNLAEKFRESCESYAKCNTPMENEYWARKLFSSESIISDDKEIMDDPLEDINASKQTDHIEISCCIDQPSCELRYPEILGDKQHEQTTDNNDSEVTSILVKDYNNFSNSKDFRVIPQVSPSTCSELSEEEYSDSELELEMITNGASNILDCKTNNRKRSSDCLQEYGIKRPCIDIEKMHRSLNTLTQFLYDDKELFLPIKPLN